MTFIKRRFLRTASSTIPAILKAWKWPWSSRLWEEDETRVSMRSRSVDVSQIALSFGGGGHVKAAGCTIKAPLPEAKESLIKALSKALQGA